MFGKIDCKRCNTRHKKGECPMDNGTPGRKKNAGGGSKEPEKPLCFPHVYTWGPYTRVNRDMHSREKRCNKCGLPKPGTRDIERHSIRKGTCTKCSGTVVE